MKPVSKYKNEKYFRGGTRDNDIIDHIKAGDIEVVRGSAEYVTEKGVVVNGKLIEADLLVFATGFDRNYFGFRPETDGLWMYRNTILPQTKNFAIVGITNTYCNPLYTNIQAV